MWRLWCTAYRVDCTQMRWSNLVKRIQALRWSNFIVLLSAVVAYAAYFYSAPHRFGGGGWELEALSYCMAVVYHCAENGDF
eukprot:3116792-Ditylum_brightwellii.AAC.1